jgi:predicted nuclease of predicted toxin-antitoxin system
MEEKFLVDVNLPKYFSYFNDSRFIHVVDINPKMTDDEIWNYALKYELIILTKDVDFYIKFISESLTPKIIYFQLGNVTLNDLHIYFDKYWSYLLTLLKSYDFLIARQYDVKVIK